MERYQVNLWRRLLPTTLALFILIVAQAGENNAETTTTETPYIDGDPSPHEPYFKDDLKEFRDFCEAQELSRNHPEKVDKEECRRIDDLDFHTDDLHILFMIFVVILYGAIVRSLLKYFHVSLPYTVFMMASGLIVGVAAKYKCYDMYKFTAFARLNAKVYLYTFLPVLLFESSFGISGHVFMKAVGQVVLLAGPGFLFCTFFTAATCYIFFTSPTYSWSILESVFFGSIISATDPVAVVAILKELGVKETLSVLVDGESLLNDGAAILLYEVLAEMLHTEDHPEEIGALVAHIFVQFVRIALGGPLFGWVMAKVAIFCLSRVFNDAVVEITATLVATYLTYYLSEAVLGVSGVMAVVFLGITMNSEKTCISPDTEHELHDFWGMLGHLANTVLFFITGVIITERGTRGLGWEDLYYLILLYFALNLIRFMMLLLFNPLLGRIGYGMPFENMIVMMWGGLRGAVGICLSLEVYEEENFCHRTLGPKVLIQTAGIVFLTLVVNGTTSRKLLQVLKLTEISEARLDEMRNAVKTLHASQKKALLMLRHDRFLSDANWSYVAEVTRVDDPYRDKISKHSKRVENTSIVSLGPDLVENVCPECHTFVPNIPTNEELRNMTEEARLRVNKAMKISYWAHFEKGVLTELAVQILAQTADECADRELYMIHCRDLKRFWQVRGFFPWFRKHFVKHVGESGTNEIPPAPTSRWKKPLWWIATKPWFEHLMTLIVLLNMIPAIWQLVLESEHDLCTTTDQVVKNYETAFQILNIIFTSIYLLEFVIKLIGLGMAIYWDSKWNWLDACVLLISILDVGLSSQDTCGKANLTPRFMFKMVKIARCFRILKLLRLLILLFMDSINGKINDQLFLGYDVALGYIMGCDDVLKFLPHMVDNKKVLHKLKTSIETERMETIREMGILQKSHPGIAIAIKTRHASRSVLNQMKSTLSDLRDDGLLDEKENDLLKLALEEKMKNLQFSPNYITPPAPEVLLQNLNWVYGHDELRDFIFASAKLEKYKLHDVIADIGDPPKGIFVIVSGMVRLHYEPDMLHRAECKNYGVIPCTEFVNDFDFDDEMEDLYSSGSIIGESQCLTGRPRAASVTCETEGVSVFHIPLSAVKDALERFNEQYNSLEERLWRSCGMRRAGFFLQKHHSYQAFSKEKIEMIVERSCCPIGPQFEVMSIPPYVHDVMVVEGWVQDGSTGELYIAPAVVPKSCNTIKLKANPNTVNRILVILAEDQGPAEDDLDDLATCFKMQRKYRKHSIDANAKIGAEMEIVTPDVKQKRVSTAVGMRRASRRSLNQGELRRGSMARASIARRVSMAPRKSILRGKNTTEQHNN